MAENVKQHPDYSKTRELMSLMVENSQLPGQGNEAFVNELSDYLKSTFEQKIIRDPEYPDRSLLVVNVGDPEGEQTLITVSHADVVGTDSQQWQSDPWKLSEDGDRWRGRGVCDTHGSGVAMLMAAMRPEVQSALAEANKHASVIFTYDEEASTPELSMRGARLAAGLLGELAVAKASYFVAGEPTETAEGRIIPMRAHKGRLLAHFIVNVERSGHVADLVQNALLSGSSIIHEIGLWAHTLTYGIEEDEPAEIYNPPYSTVQVSAGKIKEGDYSTTPSTARFTVDMRTLHDAPHEWRVRELKSLIRRHSKPEDGVTVILDIVKDAPGSVTEADSPVVLAAEAASGQKAGGFNGGDEGRIFRLDAGKEGVTIGPGELRFAHMPNEEIKISSVFKVADIYAALFKSSVNLRYLKE